MNYTTWWKRLSANQLNIAIQAFSLISIFFEGYDQGVMGGVNASPRYVEEVGIGMADGTVTDTVHQGGIVSVYYLGCIFGCFVGCTFSLIGGALQAASQSSDFIIVARVITGIGTGALTGITPVMVAETSTAEHRGGFLGYVFIANYLGISIAYWLSFGLAFVDGGNSDVRWRFLLAFQFFPALLLFLGIKMLPDTPRYLASAGRFDDAREVIEHVRGGFGPDVEREYLEIKAVAEESTKSSPIEFVKILSGNGSKPGFNLGQRAWLCLLLQIMASWTGITAVTAYSPVLLSQAGYTELTQNGLAGGLNTVGIVGTIISAQIVDRLGRRKCLMGGAFCLFTVNLIAGSLYEGSRANPDKAAQFAPAAVAMLFLFNISYAATWGTVAFLIPTEVWSSDLRAQGNGFGITGWAIGVGMTTLVNPIMFDVLENRTYFLFAGLNLVWIPIVYLFYPETSGRSLESIDALFAANSVFTWNMERNYKAHSDVLANRGHGKEGNVFADARNVEDADFKPSGQHVSHKINA
ncbi:Sugar transporter STL1 [Colletotrichum siamense]|uniref:Sugar transporter STL1 n=1 Tax=Colletotrichum siamense TaxID=690259 RepID=A0A9P5EP60_COLSI|nr:Sugar transporter STL1 [Colletotrichum siamense]KAF4855706.1 Sugar transporter STL1 [Colletotrichum siamense]